ncbi:MAG: efflux RND transporter periplasmic adaptor subunit [Gemmatimonadaceae bacterium]|nr:efflux RND transporter periplasmic adaptor subunit [Gemmatimonadaceae bacterium]
MSRTQRLTKHPARRGGSRLLIVGALALVAGLLAVGVLPRIARARRVATETGAVSALPPVTVAAVSRGLPSVELTLPATMLGQHEVGLYARSNGYVASFSADIGSRVRAGASLARIETPELDQELNVANATLTQVQATSELARTTLERWRGMTDVGAATKQEFDEKQATFQVSRANVNAARANVERLTALKAFANVVAPFAGVVTQRNTDVGALVSPSIAAGARPLFTLAQVDTLRIFTNVPQDAAPGIRVGQTVEVFVQELGATAFRGRVARTAQAIDPSTRTLLTSVEVVNRDGRLMPGMYAQVKITIPRPSAGFLIPANTLIIRADGPQVAIVRENRVHMTAIALGRDFGTRIEVLKGVSSTDQLVENPGDAVVDGAMVRVVEKRGEPRS